MTKINAKFGVAAIVAALFLAFGAFGLGTTGTSAGVLPPLQVGAGPCTPDGGTPGAAVTSVASGSTLCVRASFSGIGNTLSVAATPGTNTTATALTLLKANAVTATNGNINITPWAGDDAAAPALYEQTAATQLSYAQIPIQGANSLSYDLSVVVSCDNSNLDGQPNGSITFTAIQQGGNGINTAGGVTTTAITCTSPKAAGLSITKIDQNAGIKGATFAVQQNVNGTWVTVATMITSGTSTATNPCVSTNAACTLNPSTNTAGTFPPPVIVTGTFPTGAVRVIEVAQPANCTLVEIRNGNNLVVFQPVELNLSTATTNERTLKFVNSCAIAGAPAAAGSSIAVVVGGGTFGLSNTTHVEIIPAPGSDDDARLDVRARDANNVPLVNAHVTVSIDKGAIAMRTDTTGPSPSGYEVIEPSPAGPGYGSNAYGDTCDQTITQLFATPYTGNNTNPFISTSRTIQDSFTNNDGIVSACVYVNPDMAPGITPGKITVTAIIEAPGNFLYNPYSPQNLILTATITVVGPPASIKVAASPTSVQCGEKSTITATITDSVGQNVSDHTRVELISNFGATIGGTGSTLGFPGQGLVNPLSSSAAETFSGIATAFLLTSTEHVGPYEVVVATGGSVGGVVSTAQPGVTYTTGNFSTAPVSAQVTVTCALPVVALPPVVAAPIAAPRTGEGIRPPNTGDAGLASDNGSWAFVLAGALAFALAGVASVKFARR